MLLEKVFPACARSPQMCVVNVNVKIGQRAPFVMGSEPILKVLQLTRTKKKKKKSGCLVARENVMPFAKEEDQYTKELFSRIYLSNDMSVQIQLVIR